MVEKSELAALLKAVCFPKGKEISLNARASAGKKLSDYLAAHKIVDLVIENDSFFFLRAKPQEVSKPEPIKEVPPQNWVFAFEAIQANIKMFAEGGELSHVEIYPQWNDMKILYREYKEGGLALMPIAVHDALVKFNYRLEARLRINAKYKAS